jgi:hypothetical protein
VFIIDNYVNYLTFLSPDLWIIASICNCTHSLVTLARSKLSFSYVAKLSFLRSREAAERESSESRNAYCLVILGRRPRIQRIAQRATSQP